MAKIDESILDSAFPQSDEIKKRIESDQIKMAEKQEAMIAEYKKENDLRRQQKHTNPQPNADNDYSAKNPYLTDPLDSLEEEHREELKHWAKEMNPDEYEDNDDT